MPSFTQLNGGRKRDIQDSNNQYQNVNNLNVYKGRDTGGNFNSEGTDEYLVHHHNNYRVIGVVDQGGGDDLERK